LETASICLRKSVACEGPITDFGTAERATLLRASRLFAGLSTSEYTQLAEHARSRVFARNELLFMQGEPFRKLLLIESGCVKLTHLNPNGSEVILALRGPQEAVDLPAGPTFRNHMCTARAVSRCSALTWSSSIAERFLRTTPPLIGNICCILTTQLYELQNRYHEISADRVGRRLASTLIRLTKQFGRSVDGGTEISISRLELAQMTGTTIFTVSRLISKWEECGLVVPRRQALLMLSPERLDYLCGAED
jgi:CRP/FNR family transcriptional regulator, nitrogen oxide reductase regulator